MPDATFTADPATTALVPIGLQQEIAARQTAPRAPADVVRARLAAPGGRLVTGLTLAALAFALSAALPHAAPAQRPAAQRGQPDGIEYRETFYRGRRFQVVRVDLTRADLKLYWKDERSRPFGSLAALDRWLAGRGETLLAATNAGIFYRTRQPAGLHVERGTVLRPLNRSAHPPRGEAEGNFFAQPNGVFYLLRDGTAHIRDTEGAATPLARMVEATQSGPLLLRAGVPHSLVGSTTLSRNAIAVCGPRSVALVFAPDGASFRETALFIRAQLRCADALYLDGTISGLRVPSAGVDADGEYAGIIGITAKQARPRTARP